jgi:hypothetical protein
MQVKSKSPESKKMRVGSPAVNRLFGHPDLLGIDLQRVSKIRGG